jgi:Flp pilus assembly protein protease CpaA
MNYASKVMTLGVLVKAVLISALVTVLGATTFLQSIILVLVSAAATGVFALLVVLIQTHSERAMHERIDKLESRAGEAQSIAEGTQAIAVGTQEIAAGIAAVVDTLPTTDTEA